MELKIDKQQRAAMDALTEKLNRLRIFANRAKKLKTDFEAYMKGNE